MNQKNYRTAMLAGALIFSSISLSAQEKTWTQLIEDENATFQEIQDAFYKEWEGKDYERGHGYKQFKRWEYFWESRLMPDGSFPEVGKIQKEYAAYKSSNQAYRGLGDANWTSLGPTGWVNTDSWSPGLGRINVVVPDPNDANTLYAGAPAGGLWKSTNGGTNWTPLTDFETSIGVSGIAVDPNNSNIIYLGTGDIDAGDAIADGVYKTTDGGSTWNKMGNITSSRCGKVLIDPSNSNTVFVLTNSGFFRSANGGTSWTEVLNTTNIRDFEIKPGDPNTLYLTSNNDLYISTDNGVSFSTSGVGSGLPTSANKILLATTEADANYLYACVANTSNGFGGVYKSTNGGVSFTAQNTSTDIFEGTQAWYDFAFACSQTNRDILIEGVLNLWGSTDGGSTWTKKNNWSSPSQASYTHADIHFIEYIDGKLWVGSDGGAYVSTDNASTFTDLSSDMAISQFYRIAGIESDPDILSGGLQDNGGFRYEGNTVWNVFHGADGMESALDNSDSQEQWGMIQYGGLYHSSDGGMNTSGKGKGGGANGNWVTPMVKNPSGSGIFAGYKDLYKYTTAGGWVKLSSLALGGNIDAIEAFDDQTIYFSYNSTLYKTTNGGGNSTTVTKNWGSSSINSIEVNPNDANEVWVTISGSGSGNKIHHSTNGGTSWTDISSGLPNITCNIVKYDSSSPDNGLYVGMDIGVYYMDDNNAWTSFSDNLPNTEVLDLEINETNDLIRAGTYGRGVWESPTFAAAPTNYDISMVSITGIASNSCGNSVTPTINVKNLGVMTITSFNIEVLLNNVTVANIPHATNLANNQSEVIALSSVSISAFGSNTIEIKLTSPNSMADEKPTNNDMSTNFTINEGHKIKFSISESAKDPTYAWDIQKSSVSIIAYNDPSVSTSSVGLLESSEFCLKDDECYDFIITDPFLTNLCNTYPAFNISTIYNAGDKFSYNGNVYEANQQIWGVTPDAQPWRYNDLGPCASPDPNDYFNLIDVDDSNTELLKTTVANYSAPYSQNFCISKTVSIDENSDSEIEMTYNQEYKTVSFSGMVDLFEVFDISGKKLISETNINSSIISTSLSEGIYLVQYTINGKSYSEKIKL